MKRLWRVPVGWHERGIRYGCATLAARYELPFLGEFLHLPTHPVWFWLLLAAPWLMLLILWTAANTLKVSLKPLAPWLWVGYFLFWVPYTLVDLTGGRKTLRIALFAAFSSCQGMAIWIKRHYLFDTLSAPGAKWYTPWRAAGFSVPEGTRILVRNIDSVTPWYVDKLGLRKLAENDLGEAGVATFRFKEDGNSVVLTARTGFGTSGTPMLFTKKIAKMRDVMMARGVNVGTIERDRQGIQYFEIRDPEGNEIEVVEEH
jgi:predicted enzyme related to lactoylglutathione lyase